MPDQPDGSISRVFAQFQAGDAGAAQQLWHRFCPRLHGLARKTLAGLPQRAADAEDAVQSAFASFLRRVGEGEFGADLDRDDLWNLLGLITVRKSLQQGRREQAEKRGGGRVLDEAALVGPEGKPQRLDDFAGQAPTRDFDVHCEELLMQLDEELRVFAVLRLLGYRNREIAERLDCTERRVERKLNLIRLRWQREGDA